MTRRTTTGLICCAALLAALALPRTAAANSPGMPDPPWIEEVTQEGADVVITFVMDTTNWTSSNLIALERTDDDGVNCVAKNGSFDASEALETELFCPSYSQSPMCESFPENCFDCDGDDEPECLNGCGLNGWFEIVDDCVPAGDAGYRLFGKWDGWEPWESHGALNVLESEADCEPSAAAGPCDEPSSDADADADADADSDADSDSDTDAHGDWLPAGPGDADGGGGGSCSVSLAVTSQSLEGCGLFVLMLAIGLVAVVVRRRAR
jgi:hypothetical protein